MDIVVEAAATTAFILGFFFGPGALLQVYRAVRG